MRNNTSKPASDAFGYIIANDAWEDSIKLEMGMGSFARTTADAWRRHVGYEKASTIDFSIIVQRWHDRGYRPFRVRVEMVPPVEVAIKRRGVARR